MEKNIKNNKDKMRQTISALCHLTLACRRLTLTECDTVGWQEEHPAHKKNWVMRCWRGYLSGAKCIWLAMVQLMPLPPIISDSVKSTVVYPLVLAHLGHRHTQRNMQLQMPNSTMWTTKTVLDRGRTNCISVTHDLDVDLQSPAVSYTHLTLPTKRIV